MKLKNSLVNSNLYLHTLKQHVLLAKISLITFSILIITSVALDDHNFIFPSIVFLLSCVILPSLYPILIYDYLHDSTKATHLRSIAIKMSSVFITYLCVGLTLVLGTLMLECFTLLFVSNGLVEKEFFVVVFFLAIYYFVLGLLACLVSGTKKMALILTFVFYGLPTLLAVLLNYVSIHHAFGIQYLQMNSDFVYFLMPLASGLEYLSYDHEWPFFIWHLLQCIVFFGLSFYLMTYRKEERIGDNFMIKHASLIIRLALLVGATSGIYLLLSSFIKASGFNDYIFRLDTLFVATGCLVTVIIELIFNKKINLKPCIQFYLPVIAVMVFILHYNGDYLSNPKRIDNYELSQISLYDGIINAYQKIDMKDTKEIVDYIFAHFKSEPKNYTSGKVLMDVNLYGLYGVDDYNYEFVLEKDQFNTLLDKFSALRTMYYDQGLNLDYLKACDYILVYDFDKDTHRLIQGNQYKQLVNAIDDYFNDPDYWLNHKMDSSSHYAIEFYKNNRYDLRIEDLPDNHPFIEAIASNKYIDASMNTFFNECITLLEKNEDLSYLVDDSSLAIDIQEIRLDKYGDYGDVQILDTSIKLNVWAEVHLKTLYDDISYIRERVTLTFTKDQGKTKISKLEFDELFYESYGE